MKTRVLLINFNKHDQEKIQKLGVDVDLGYVSDSQNLIDHSGSIEESASFYSPLAIYEYKAIFIKLSNDVSQKNQQTKTIGENEKANFLNYWSENKGILTVFLEDCNFNSLSIFGIPQIDINSSSGNDITIFFPLQKNNSLLRNALSELESFIAIPPQKYLKIKQSEPRTGKPWTIFPVYQNRNDDKVGAYLNWGYPFSDKDLPAFLVLPSFKDYKEVISKLLRTFGQINPEYFPEIKGSDWVKENKYYPKKISEIDLEITNAEVEANIKIKKLNDQKVELKKEYNFLLELLTQTGDKLKQSVITTLTQVFLLDAEDMDKGKKNNFREDILIKDLFLEPILTEIKGTKNSYPSFTYVTQVFSNLLKGRDQFPNAIGGLILNHDREKNPDERSRAYTNPDEEKQLNEIFYLDTRVLFLLAKAVIDGDITTSEARKILKKKGRVAFNLTSYVKSKATSSKT